MLNKTDAKALIQKVIQFSSASETEVHIGGGNYSLTRFANNHIHQNVDESNLEISIRVVLDDKRSARTSTNRRDDAGLKKAVASAIQAAKLSKPDPGLLPLLKPESKELTTRSYVDPATRDATAMQRAEKVVDVIAAVKKHGLNSAGQLTTACGSIGSYGDAGVVALGNSHGLFRYYNSTEANFSLTVMAPDSSGWVSDSTWKLSSIDFEKLTQSAIEKAKMSANPRALKPGKYTVILEPAAVAELVQFLNWGFSAKGYHSGSSWTAGRLNKKVVGKNFSLKDDPYDPRLPSTPFDGEGVVTQKLELIKSGRLNTLFCDRRTAKKHKLQATGHGPRLPSPWGGAGHSLICSGGDQSREDLIKSTKKGILVTRLWYNRLVEPKEVVVTGMTRDGTFYVEDGKIACGVKNMRYNVSVLEVLRNILAASPVERANGMLAPALKINDFYFSSVTRF